MTGQCTIAHLSDLHYFSPTLWADCPDFRAAENADRKLLRESGAILDRALDEIVRVAPDVVLVSGDLTKDGELVCHEEVREKFAAARERLAARGKRTAFCVINGNHDINNASGARDYSSGEARRTPLAGPYDFRRLWDDFGMDAAYARFDDCAAYAPHGGCMSYAVRPVEGATLIAVDTCKYTRDQNGLDRDVQVTEGVVGERLLAWVEEQARAARASGDVVIAVQHHGVIPHFGMEARLMGEYLVDNYEECQRRYADAGIAAVFTGHMHAHDVARVQTAAGNVLFDVETGSTVTYPCEIRFAALSWTAEAGEPARDVELSVESHALGVVSFRDLATGELREIADIGAYAHERLLSVQAVQSIVADVVAGPRIDALVAHGGVRAALAGLARRCGLDEVGASEEGTTEAAAGARAAGAVRATAKAKAGVFAPASAEPLDVALFSSVLRALPQGRANAHLIVLGELDPRLGRYGVMAVWADANAGRVVLERADGPRARMAPEGADGRRDRMAPGGAGGRQGRMVRSPFGMLYGRGSWSYRVDVASFARFIGPVLDALDAELAGPGKRAVLELLRTWLGALLGQRIGHGGETIFDLVKFAYAEHLHGEESCPLWAEAAIAALARTGVGGNSASPVDVLSMGCMGVATEATVEGGFFESSSRTISNAPMLDGSFMSCLRASVNAPETLAAARAFLSRIPINLNELCVRECGFGPIPLIAIKLRDLGAVFDAFGDEPGDRIPHLPTVTSFIYDAFFSLTHDDLALLDRRAVMPLYGPAVAANEDPVISVKVTPLATSMPAA